MYAISLLALAAVGVSAHPSAHAHLHRHAHAHDKRDPAPAPNPAVGDLVTATIYGKVVTWTNTYDGKGSPFIQGAKPVAETKPSPTPSPSPALAPAASLPSAAAPPVAPAAPSSAPASDSSSSSGGKGGSGVTSYTPFCGGGSGASKKRATADQIAYAGNTGTKDKWGCNMQLVADGATADKYKYTAKFSNQASGEQTCTCFNKIGPKGLIDGFFFEGIKWTMAPGTTQYLAFDANTQGGCACNAGSTLRKTPLGQLAGTWLEFDFENASNKGWSGADSSSLVAEKYGMQVDALEVCQNGVCSTIFQGGGGKNAYLGGMEDLDGVGLNIPAGKCQLDVKVGAK